MLRHVEAGSGFRLRVCQRAGCETAFLDVSRNGRRRFCSLRCANQVNVANHRLRQWRAA
jgi:predicted RNA-binding Zn ribbon-like protein